MWGYSLNHPADDKLEVVVSRVTLIVSSAWFEANNSFVLLKFNFMFFIISMRAPVAWLNQFCIVDIEEPDSS